MIKVESCKKTLKAGDFKRTGAGISSLSSKISGNSIVLIYQGLILGGYFIITSISGTNNNEYIYAYIFMLGSVGIFIPICFIIPELILLAYYKKRFPSFFQNS